MDGVGSSHTQDFGVEELSFASGPEGRGGLEVSPAGRPRFSL